MSDIHAVGTISQIDDLHDVELIDTGVEGDLGFLHFGEQMVSHLLSMPPGLYPAHSHPIELLILCVKGECDVFQGEGDTAVRRRMRPHSFIHVPRNGDIGIDVDGDEPCDFLVVAAPPPGKTREQAYAGLRRSFEERRARG